jgi:putative ABC transport system permease protein
MASPPRSSLDDPRNSAYGSRSVAAPRQIVGVVLGSGLKLAAGGLALGLAIAVPGALFLASQFHRLSPWSISALGLSSVIVMVAAVAAAAQPATRVLRIQPGDIVRTE